jgi:hypothetical protein
MARDDYGLPIVPHEVTGPGGGAVIQPDGRTAME